MSRHSRRRPAQRGQGLAEFAMVFPIVLALIAGAAMTLAILFIGWSADRATEWLGARIAADGGFGPDAQAGFVARAAELGTPVDTASDTLVVTVTAGTGNAACGDPVCTYGWGDTAALSYGDLVSVTYTHGVDFPVMSAWIEAVTYTPHRVVSSWSGIAQRNTIDPGAVVVPGRQTGAINGTVYVERFASGLPVYTPVPGARVALDTGVSVIADSGGAFSFTEVLAGGRTVTAYAPAFADASSAVAVTAGQTAQIDIVTTDAVTVVVAAGRGFHSDIAANGGFESGFASWTAAASAFTNASTASVIAGAAAQGSAGVRVTTDTSAPDEGISQALSGTFTTGETYTAVLLVRAPKGAEGAVLLGTLTGGDSASAPFTGTGAWEPVVIDWVPIATYGNGVFLGLRASGSTPAGVVMDVDGVMLYAMSDLRPAAAVSTDTGLGASSLGGGFFVLRIDPATTPVISVVDGAASGSAGPLTLTVGKAVSVYVTSS